MSSATQAAKANLMDYPVWSRVQDIDTEGKSLSSLIPIFRQAFNDRIDLITGEEEDKSIGSVLQGLDYLQDAIEYKRKYRDTTSCIPSWVYWVFDALGWSSVARAEKELHRQITALFDKTVTTPTLNRLLDHYVKTIKACYLKEHLNHEIFTKYKDSQSIQSILIRLGIVKPDFGALLAYGSQKPDELATFEWKLKAALIEDPHHFDKLLYPIDPKGPSYNLIQLAIHYCHDDIATKLLSFHNDNILTFSGYGPQKSHLVQPFIDVPKQYDDVMELLAERKGWKIAKSLAPHLKEDYGVIVYPKGGFADLTRECKLLLYYLLYNLNALNYPHGSNKPEGPIYFFEPPKAWPDPSKRKDVMQAANPPYPQKKVEETI